MYSLKHLSELLRIMYQTPNLTTLLSIMHYTSQYTHAKYSFQLFNIIYSTDLISTFVFDDIAPSSWVILYQACLGRLPWVPRRKHKLLWDTRKSSTIIMNNIWCGMGERETEWFKSCGKRQIWRVEDCEKLAEVRGLLASRSDGDVRAWATAAKAYVWVCDPTAAMVFVDIPFSCYCQRPKG